MASFPALQWLPCLQATLGHLALLGRCISFGNSSWVHCNVLVVWSGREEHWLQARALLQLGTGRGCTCCLHVLPFRSMCQTPLGWTRDDPGELQTVKLLLARCPSVLPSLTGGDKASDSVQALEVSAEDFGQSSGSLSQSPSCLPSAEGQEEQGRLPEFTWLVSSCHNERAEVLCPLTAQQHGGGARSWHQ